jgi:hypothetical protein
MYYLFYYQRICPYIIYLQIYLLIFSWDSSSIPDNVGLSVCLSVNNEFQGVQNALKVQVMILFQYIIYILVHSMHNIKYK